MAVLIPNTTVDVLDPKTGQFTLPWRRFLERLPGVSTGTQGPAGPAGAQGPAGKSASADGLEFAELGSLDWELIAGQGIAITPASPSFGGPTTISALLASGVIGWDGADGEDGPPGSPGLQGATGPQGPAGASGQSLIGPPGMDGEPGEDGWPIPGAQGVTGPTGSAGAAGSPGLTIPGFDGEPGEDGWSVPSPQLAALGAHTTAIGTGQVDSLTSGGPGAAGQVWTSNGASADPTFQTLLISPPGGRLTLTAATPVMTANATAQTTIHYCTYVNGYVPVWNGTVWVYLAIGSDDISMGLDAVTPHVASGSLYDVFGINNSGTLVIAIGPAWSSTTSRGTGAGTTELQLKNGIWTNKNSLTHAWGGGSGTTDFGAVSANQATYLGTFNATANGQTGMNFIPAAASGGGGAALNLYNGYNRVRAFGMSRDNNNWTYASTVWRSADGSTGNRVTFVDGLQQSSIMATYTVLGFISSAADNATVGINFDSTSATPTVTAVTTFVSNSASFLTMNYSQPLLGLHFAQAMEQATVGGTATFDGNANSNQFAQISAELWM